jgi:hypothetical protein
LIEESNDLHNDIARLKKLKVLDIETSIGIDPKKVTCDDFITKATLLTSSQIIRNCRQVEILRVSSYEISLRDLADLEHYENLKEVHLHWSQGPSLVKALSKLERCTNWRRLTLTKKNISLSLTDEVVEFTPGPLVRFPLRMNRKVYYNSQSIPNSLKKSDLDSIVTSVIIHI